MSDIERQVEATVSDPSGNGAQPRAAVPPPPAPARPSVLGLAFDLLLVGLIVVGVVFRFSWVNWNQDTDIHPDEYGLTSTITQLRVPGSLGDYFNTRISTLSPYQKYDIAGNPLPPSGEHPMPDNRMRWGQWPIVIIRYAAELTDNTAYRELRLMGRRLSAGADTLALGVIFLIGWRLYGRRVGLLAAALSALAVMQIQQSHFMTSDNFGTLFTLLAMYAAVRVATDASQAPPADTLPVEASDQATGTRQLAARPAPYASFLWYALFGLFFGMALATRINLLPLAAMIGLAAFIHYARVWQRGGGEPGRLLGDAALRLALAGAAAFLAFRVCQPMTFRAETGDTTLLTLNLNPEWLASMRVAQAESSGQGGGPPGEQWTARTPLLFPWINMVVWGMGLPLGLAAWAGLVWAGWRSLRDEDESWKLHLLPLAWTAGYFLFMGTRWVMSVRYFLPIYPFLALFAAWAIVELWRQGNVRFAGDGSREQPAPTTAGTGYPPLLRLSAVALGAIVLAGTLAWAWGFTSIYRNENTRVQASRWMYQNVPGAFNVHMETGNGSRTEPVPSPHIVNIGAEPHVAAFTPRVNGTLTGLTIGYARSPFDWSQPGVLHVMLAADSAGSQVLASGVVNVPGGDVPRGETYQVLLAPTALEAGQTYYIVARTVQGGPVEVRGSVLANENWDEHLPLRVDGRDGFGGLYRGQNMDIHWHDSEDKRQMMLQNLAQVDYVILPSQRRLWASTRIPATYPMTMEYYRALFDGRLGFELAAEFHSPFVIGPLQVSDTAGTWAWGQRPPIPPPRDNPFNYNTLAAEEAFSVYDHAPVWIFRKRADFDIVQAAAVLNAVDLSQVVVQGPRDATRVPTLLRLPPDRLQAQAAGGTWSEMFDAEGLLNRYEFLGAAAWWLMIVAFGWLAFPLTYAALGGLADRGYALAKTVALLFTAWLVWMWGSYQWLPFTRGTIALGFAVLALISAVIYWRRRAGINAFIWAHRRHILVVEGLALSLFAFMLLIRLGNPDLWHPNFGGEKPMVFSFFNAVLKSTSFPPYNPWLSEHYLNYYYYGFVVVALPTKLLGIVPAFAYNLILPMLFALTGTAAFSVAYNLVAGRPEATEAEAGSWKLEAASDAAPAGELTDDQPAEPPTSGEAAPAAERANEQPGEGGPAGDELAAADVASARAPAQPPFANDRLRPAPAPANPYIAGVAAALMIVVLGNLAQVHVFLDGFRRAADTAALQGSFFGDGALATTLNGAWRVATGQSDLPVAPHHLYWNASRIVADLARTGEHAGGNEITEFPFFTFLYADLHAHMIDMPFVLLSLAWALSFLLAAGRPRPRLHLLAMWLVGGLAIGMPRAANTWDFPLFLALGIIAVAVGQWQADPRITRSTLFGLGWRVLLLVGLAFLLYRPFDNWFAAAYSEVKFWDGTRTPINAYLYVHGLFLFILASFLAWETRRWLAETPASVLNRAGEWLPFVLLGAGALLVAVVVLWRVRVPSAVVALPLMAWAGLLLLRPPAALSMPRRAVLFLMGTALAVTLFVEVAALEGDRMNTIFKFYIQVWLLFSVAAGAALAWLWATLPAWKPSWRTAWTVALAVLVASAGLYTITASVHKMRDRFPARLARADHGCAPIEAMPLPYQTSLAPRDQPLGLNGMDFMTWSAYCDRDRFLPLVYDHDAIRWMQANVPGSPVIAEAQTFDLYRMGSRYAWFTGLPNVVGWDWHTRQHNGAIPTGFVTQRGVEVSAFYTTPSIEEAVSFLARYDVGYVVVGPMEYAYYGPTAGLLKFGDMVARGQLAVAYENPGVTIYQVLAGVASQ
jgi:YYY domain-containing protein